MVAHLDALHEASNRRLLTKIPTAQLDRVFASDMCELQADFLGFVGIYERLAEIIPLEWTVVDLGCAHAAQAFFFERHARYIGVDLLTKVKDRFAAANSEHRHMPIKRFVKLYLSTLCLSSTFAICSYVPSWGADNSQLARTNFLNVFTYYPSSISSPLANLIPAAAAPAE